MHSIIEDRYSTFSTVHGIQLNPVTIFVFLYLNVSLVLTKQSDSRRFKKMFFNIKSKGEIRLFGKCLSLTDPSLTTMHLCTNMKPNLSNLIFCNLYFYRTK